MGTDKGKKAPLFRDGRLVTANLRQPAARDRLSLFGPIYLGHLLLIALAAAAACTLVPGFGRSFWSIGSVVRGRPRAEASQSGVGSHAPSGRLVPISHGHRMFLECTGESHGAPTVILATGRGIGNYQGWALVQSRVSAFARVCTYDPLGAGESDHVSGSPPVSEVVENMHDLFRSAQLPGPYVLVGISMGGVLIRHYEETYPTDVAGFVFVDSSHEEMMWRDAAISTAFSGPGDDLASLQHEGLLAPKQHLVWHDDVPIIVLERTVLPPCSAFPGLTQTQCDQINEAWHSFQVDLSHRSRHGQLRPVAGSGHAMQQERPDAIAQAISDVLNEVKTNRKPR
jgi:pimeloyl-ACP methyl ester carboxylesterase